MPQWAKTLLIFGALAIGGFGLYTMLFKRKEETGAMPATNTSTSTSGGSGAGYTAGSYDMYKALILSKYEQHKSEFDPNSDNYDEEWSLQILANATEKDIPFEEEALNAIIYVMKDKGTLPANFKWRG